MSKLLKNPYRENSPLAGSVEVNSPAKALPAAHPNDHQNNPKAKLLKNSEEQLNKPNYS